MKKFLIVLAILAVLLFAIRYAIINYTKRFSPEVHSEFTDGKLTIDIFYSSPAKKGREIFGNLVPYDSLWRTGANEATVFATNQDLLIDGKVLKAGKYSLWTIPREQFWTVIFNKETGQWGIDYSGLPNRNPQKDALAAQATSVVQDKEIEKFTIFVEKADDDYQLVFMWDKTVVSLPLRLSSR